MVKNYAGRLKKLTYAERMRADGKFPAVLRFASLTPADVAGMIAHAERRIGCLDHIDFSRSRINTILVHPRDENGELVDLPKHIAEESAQMSRFNLKSNLLGLRRAGRRKEARAAAERGLRDPWLENRKSGPPLREGILTVHRDFFRAADDCPAEDVLEFLDDQGETARFDMRKCRRFVEASEEFLEREFGEALLYSRADFDEQSVHLQFLVVDRVREPESTRYAHGRWLYRTTQHRCIGGVKGDPRRGYEVAQDAVAEWFAQPQHSDMNIVRGEPRAARRREAEAEVDAALEAAAAEALFGESEELPAGSKHAQAMFLLRKKIAEQAAEKGGVGKIRKDAKQDLALELLEILGTVSPEERHQASTRRARAALLERHQEAFGSADDMLADPDAVEAQVMSRLRAEKEAADRARREADEAAQAERERLDREAQERRRREDAERAARVRREDEERARKAEDLVVREQEVDRKIGWLEETLRELQGLGDAIRDAARRLGVLELPWVQRGLRAAARVSDVRKRRDDDPRS